MRTLYDKIWDEHVVHTEDDGTAIIYIDRHLVHEVTSPQAFEGLREAGRKVWRISSIVATADHNTPTTGWELGYDGLSDPISKEQITTLDNNIAEFGAAAYFPFLSKRQGIVHVMGPETGATLPGMTVVCGDSHTSTHGAFGARHRHQRGRACHGHANAAGQKSQEHAGQSRRHAGPGPDRQRHRAGHHRQDRHRRRYRLHH
jgi:3-isopropylmalate/(R)-2-methylmalate dehydratase large subunit